MKKTHLIDYLAAALLAAVATLPLRAADEPAPAESKPNREELREKLKKMTPEERRAALQEWREKNPEAAARMKEARKGRDAAKDLTPEEREARMKQRRAAMETRTAALEKKKAAGTITTQESQQLERMERVLKSGSRVPPRRHDGEKRSQVPPGEPKTPSEK